MVNNFKERANFIWGIADLGENLAKACIALQENAKVVTSDKDLKNLTHVTYFPQ